MKKITFMFLMFIASCGFSQKSDFPINFESGTLTFTDFDGGATTVIANPSSSGINTSAMVAQMVKGAGQDWAGSKLELSGALDFTANQVFTMKVYSPKANVPVLFKLENGDGSVATQKSANTTVENQWETLSFDFSGSTSDVYTNLVFIFELGTMGDGTANFTYLFDDIEFIPSALPALILPIDFEGGPYDFTNFDGGTATVIANPQSSGINTSATVAQIVRDGGQTWGGSKLILNDKIDFATKNTFSMKVYSTRANVPVLFKLEGDAGAATEVSMNTTVANEWETISWDFTGKPTEIYNTLVLMFDFGTVGDGSNNSTFLFDDIELTDNTGGLSQIDLPVNFEDATVNYALTDFGDNSSVLGADPINAENTVAITTKTTGAATWAGTTIGTALCFATVIPLTDTETKMSVMVYSPAVGIKVRLKAEDHNDVTLTVETEATTTSANSWEKLVFDFSNVAEGTNPYNPNTNFDKVSIFFDFGNEGTNAIYYWDDVEFYGATTEENYTVTFSVKDANATALVDAEIEFLNKTMTTDINGIAEFTSVSATTNAEYTVTKSGYINATGTATVVDVDLNISVTLLSVGIENEMDLVVNIYPNPVQASLNINCEIGSDITIYTILGEKVLRTSNSTETESLDLSLLNNGVYFIKVTKGDKSITSKIIKN